MYQSLTSTEAPLHPHAFVTDESHLREGRAVFESTWQLAGLASMLSQPGQYVSLHIGETPVIVRNFDGQLVALRNVCAHRHCTLVTEKSGRSEKLKCPFHGWEYGGDGRTRRIPAPKNFPDFDRERYRLNQFSLDQCGDLVFVRIAKDGPPLQEWLGYLFDRLETWTMQPNWKPAVARTLQLPANWKIPVEASLESYHIPEVHPHSFGEDPGEQKSEHEFARYSSSFFTSFNTPRWIDKLLKVYEKFILGILGVPFTGKYEHHHVFPNLMISHTDSLTLVQVVRPVSGVSALTDVWQYGRQSNRRNPISSITAVLWGKFTAWLSYQILKEDIAIYPQVQQGERAAVDQSVLGRCEERLYVFERFVHDMMSENSRGAEAVYSSDEASSCPCDLKDAQHAEDVRQTDELETMQ